MIGGAVYYAVTQTDIVDQINNHLKNTTIRLPTIRRGNNTGGNTTGGGSGTVSNITPVKGVGFDRNGVTKIYATAGGKESYNAVNSDNPGRKEWDINSAGFLNMEMTGYFLTAHDEIAFKLRGGDHTDSCPSCGCVIQVRATDGSGNFAIECPHPQYDFHNIPTRYKIRSVANRWIGVKAIVFNSGGKVMVQAYIDDGGLINGKPANQWRLWYTTTVTGSKFLKNPINGPKAKVSFRIDNTNTQAKFMSIREIG